MKRPFIPLGCDQQGRMTPTALLRYEDATGMCNTCPGELEPAEAMQREPGPEPYPWRPLLAGFALLLAVVGCVSVIAAYAPPTSVVATR